MLGQNDVSGEIFTIEDGVKLKDFAVTKQIGRLSVWSLNRDRACSNNWPDITKVSDSCSGLKQETGEFSRLFAAKVDNGPDTPAPKASDDETSAAIDPEEIVDDPKTSPYQIWNNTQAYLADERVVWRRNVYVAKWWTSGDVPDDPTVDDESAPWRLIGPVLENEKPAPEPKLPAGTYPAWNPDAVYVGGDRVQIKSVGYEAKWWVQGTNPQAPSTKDVPSPWRRLTALEINEVLKKNKKPKG